MATINQLLSALNVNNDELANLIKYQLNEKLVRYYVDYDESDYDFEENEVVEDDFEEHKYDHTYVSYFPWEETHKDLVELFRELDYSLRSNILTLNNIPDYLPHPWVGKGLIKILSGKDRYEGEVYLYLHLELKWSLDSLRKLKNPIVLKVNKNRRSSKLIELQNLFLSEHHINVQIKLIEKITKDFQYNGEIHTKSSEDLFYELVETWYWIYENSPTSLKGIRVRDIFSYYEELKKLKINLEPSYPLPIDGVLKDKVGGSFQGYSVAFPKESKELKWWGEKLHHCVGGYGEAVGKGYCSILSLNKGENPIYTIEVRKSSHYEVYELIQFRGYGNSPAPEELVDKFKKLIL